VTAASPLRGPRAGTEAASPPLIFRARRARLRGRSSGLQGASRFLRKWPSGHPGPRRPRRPLGQARAGRRRACPGQARGAQARGSRRLQAPRRQEQSELAFDTQKKRRKNYTNAGPATRSGSLITAEPPGEAASHRTRCARNPGCSTQTRRHSAAHPGTPGKIEPYLSTEQRKPRSRAGIPVLVVVVRGRVELPTFRFSGGRSYQLSYLTSPGALSPRRAVLTGFEPATSTLTGWRALLAALQDHLYRRLYPTMCPQRDSNPCRRLERAVS
jgi:hypothetical protein